MGIVCEALQRHGTSGRIADLLKEEAERYVLTEHNLRSSNNLRYIALDDKPSRVVADES